MWLESNYGAIRFMIPLTHEPVTDPENMLKKAAGDIQVVVPDFMNQEFNTCTLKLTDDDI